MSHTDEPKLDRTNWPIAAAMIQYPALLLDGRSTQDQSAEDWFETLADVADAGFSEFDPTDSWLRVADLEPSRLDEFMSVVGAHGLTIPGISTARRNLIDPKHGEAHVAYGHRVLDTAARIGAAAVSFGFFSPLTDAQRKALWFWTVDGVKNPDDPETFRLAVERVRDLGRHAGDLGLEVALEMYEDTLLGTADGAVRLVTEIDLPNVKINADLGNLVRLHREVEPWQAMMEKLAPFCGYWHIKNYTRMEDASSGLVMTAPAPLEFGTINYRAAIRMALAHGFRSPFLVEHYGGDGLSVSAANRDYLRKILPRPGVQA
ncbi:sugar phosphate isomerase/epimerase [Aureimonas sp. AU20]|uniref:sugar phosphate isomerase/epimerase family protein n=1 Tax=Aureimonas sp. AU20 TaxID=1349819 RepID=UPI00071FD14E|nr:sugar phosphate isomerase/epimerase family protein [Aureimonas sp. AU20]ALN72446.1 hypothetical protein M673_06945 [Aureimonas sp. AU20]